MPVEEPMRALSYSPVRSPASARMYGIPSQRQRSPVSRKPPEPLRRAVADCLSPAAPNLHGAPSALASESARTLRDYIANPSTTDMAYNVLIDHALAERDRSRMKILAMDEGKMVEPKWRRVLVIAIKKVKEPSMYNREVNLLRTLCHESVVRMIGFCNDENSIVLAYTRKGSLHDWLGGLSQKQPLEWDDRVKIALCVAKGLEFLHCDTKPPLIHRDLKPANILLEDDMSAKITDFGLAVSAQRDGGFLRSKVAVGTVGYICPDYQITGRCSIKSDIFSYGMVLLGLISGWEADESNSEALLKWACKDVDNFVGLADPKLKHYNETSFKVIAEVAVRCLVDDPSARPSIKDIINKFKQFERPTEKSFK